MSAFIRGDDHNSGVAKGVEGGTGRARPRVKWNSGDSKSVSLSAVGSANSGSGSYETDVVVIGSGVGGLSTAAVLATHGDSVTVLESHYLPGGVAHAFEIDGYKFDAGPSLWAGMSEPGTNPLRQILDILEEKVLGFWGEGACVRLYSRYMEGHARERLAYACIVHCMHGACSLLLPHVRFSLGVLSRA